MTPPNVTPDPEVTPTTPPEGDSAPPHGHIEPTFNPIPGAGEVILFARPATVDIGQKVLLTASGVQPKIVQSADFYLGGTGCFGWVGQHTEPGLDGAGLAAEVRYASEGTYTAAVTVHTKDGPLQGTCEVTVTAEGACPAEPDVLHPPRVAILAAGARVPRTDA